MRCPRCGTDNLEGARFCEACGAPLAQAASGARVDTPFTAYHDKTASPDSGAGSTGLYANLEAEKTEPPKQKSILLPVLLVVCLVLVAAVTIFLLVRNSKPTISLNRYLIVEFYGYDGEGTASARIDWQAILDDYAGKLEYTEEVEKIEGASLLYLVDPILVLQECVDVELEPDDNLSNGDKIRYRWDVDDELEKVVEVRIRYSGGTVEVKDLLEAPVSS